MAAPIVTAALNCITALLALKRDGDVLQGEFLALIYDTNVSLESVATKIEKYEGNPQLYEVICDIEDFLNGLWIPKGRSFYTLSRTQLGGVAQYNVRLKHLLQTLLPDPALVLRSPAHPRLVFAILMLQRVVLWAFLSRNRRL
ncbi:hypothetical protein VPH35_014409 [Triticum aestivum]